MRKGTHHTLKTKKKLSEFAKGQWERNEIPISHLLKRGHKINVGRKHTEESKKKMSKIRKDNPISYWLGKKRSEISKKRMSNAQRGKNSPRWKGGISPINKRIRNSIDFKLWRNSIYERDYFTCKKCGKKSEAGRRIFLHPHHIQNFAQYPKLRFAIDNGITLCKDCHRLFHKLYGFKNNNYQQIIDFLKGRMTYL